MKLRCAVLVALAVLLLASRRPAWPSRRSSSMPIFQPARPDQPKHAAALAFKEHVEKATNAPSRSRSSRLASSETTPTPCRGSGWARWTWPWPMTVPSP